MTIRIIQLGLLFILTPLLKVQGQSLPYNPDSDGDEFVSVVDLMSLLSWFGESTISQSCFKGEVCICHSSASNVSSFNHVSVETSCGTIIGKTGYPNNSASGGPTLALDLSNEGYSEGDVLHLYLDVYSPGFNQSFKLYTNIDGNLVNFKNITFSGSSSVNSQTLTGKVIYNGEYWESLD